MVVQARQSEEWPIRDAKGRTERFKAGQEAADKSWLPDSVFHKTSKGGGQAPQRRQWVGRVDKVMEAYTWCECHNGVAGVVLVFVYVPNTSLWFTQLGSFRPMHTISCHGVQYVTNTFSLGIVS